MANCRDVDPFHRHKHLGNDSPALSQPLSRHQLSAVTIQGARETRSTKEPAREPMYAKDRHAYGHPWVIFCRQNLSGSQRQSICGQNSARQRTGPNRWRWLRGRMPLPSTDAEVTTPLLALSLFLPRLSSTSFAHLRYATRKTY